MRREELLDGGRRIENGETLLALEWQEQRDCEAAIEVRQRDQHEPAARPDVQRVCVELVVSLPIGRQRQFLVAMRQQLFGAARAGVLDEAAADR